MVGHIITDVMFQVNILPPLPIGHIITKQIQQTLPIKWLGRTTGSSLDTNSIHVPYNIIMHASRWLSACYTSRNVGKRSRNSTGSSLMIPRDTVTGPWFLVVMVSGQRMSIGM